MVYNLVGKPLVDRADPMMVTMSAIVWGTLPLAFFVPADAAALPGSAWLALLFLSLVCTIFGFLVWSWALKRTEAARLGAVVYLIPLVTIVSGLVTLHEPVTPGLVIGGAVLVAGVVIAET
jgi:drug/metabolite transporter (DMT)-like permease